ncbi:MAG: formylglycine-generating enzyme family protein [Alcaligenaceae bacterium]|nr:formylglycine-generating enzyme family protein [Alcaligenaceae bacterium]
MRARVYLGGGAAIAVVVALVVANRLWPGPDAIKVPVPEVSIPAGTFTLQAPGEFLDKGLPVPAPRIQVRIPAGLGMMTHLVSQAEYAACVHDGACKPLDRGFRDPAAPDHPAIGISWHDATAYAQWLSRQTGQNWRLPDYAEWARAAAERYHEADPLPADPDDPAVRWQAEYARQIERRGLRRNPAQPLGYFGENSLGFTDMAGNVWEWPNTCFTSHRAGAPILSPSADCGVRILAGAHRAAMPDFVRDPRLGTCLAGPPPANLGFRLVRAATEDITSRVK